MKVYKLRFGEEYEWLLPVQDRDFERLRFDGRPRASSWVPVEMKRLSVSERGRRLTAGDLYACSGGETLVFGDGARQSLGPELERYGEVLPLSCEGRPFWTLNVTSFVDALDESFPGCPCVRHRRDSDDSSVRLQGGLAWTGRTVQPAPDAERANLRDGFLRGQAQ